MRRGLYRHGRQWVRKRYPRIQNDQSTLYATSLSIACPAGHSVTVLWGDGTSGDLTCDGAVHTLTKNYAATGDYQISVIGDVHAITTFICWYQPWLSGSYSTVISGLQAVEKLHIWGCSFVGAAGDFSHLTALADLLYTRGANVITDGDMGAAGVASWGVVDSVLTKEGSAYQGTQCLRVTRTGATYWAMNSELTDATEYRFTGVTRGDGGADVQNIFMAGGAGYLLATANVAEWQIFDFTVTSTDVSFFIGSRDDTVAGYNEWDAIYVTEVV